MCPLGIRNITFQLIESSVDLADRGLSPLTSPILVHKRTSVVEEWMGLGHGGVQGGADITRVPGPAKDRRSDQSESN